MDIAGKFYIFHFALSTLAYFDHFVGIHEMISCNMTALFTGFFSVFNYRFEVLFHSSCPHELLFQTGCTGAGSGTFTIIKTSDNQCFSLVQFQDLSPCPALQKNVLRQIFVQPLKSTLNPTRHHLPLT
jgi:hypothetical protein